MKYTIGSIILLMALLAALASAQTSRDRFFPLEEVRPGLHGIGKTVFEGQTVEEFGVEILGVLPGKPGPKQSVIIARLTGPRIERTNIFAGMSGSPVYIDGRLLGAIAYSFQFATEPIAGITPIQNMIEVLRAKPEANVQAEATASSRRAPLSAYPKSLGRSPGQLSAQDVLPSLGHLQLEEVPVEASALAGSGLPPFAYQRLLPIATPLSVSGISTEAIERFLPELRKVGLMPFAGISGGASITPLSPTTESTLQPGKSLSVQLVRGDFSMEAVGTVTYRDGENIYAFGHRLFNLGGIEMPVSEASTLTIVPSLLTPFKFAVTENLVGTLSQDRSTGVFGKLGLSPKMIPVSITEKTSRGGTEIYRFELINNDVFTPLLLNLTVFSAITSSERTFGDVTLRLRGKIAVRGQEDVVLDNRFSAINEAPTQASLSAALPVTYLLGSGFDDVQIEAITLDIEAVENRRVGMLDRVWVSRTDVHRGETLDLHIYARTEDGQEFVQRLPVEIPADAPIGRLSLIVGDGAALQAYDGRPALVSLSSARNLAQLIRTLNRLRKGDRLYLKIVRASSGAVVKNEELPSLPPSVLATIGSERTSGGYQPVQYATLKEMEIPPVEFIITGQHQVIINVVK